MAATDIDQTPEISLEEYAAEQALGVTIDVRERAEYAPAHVPGAVLVPMGSWPPASARSTVRPRPRHLRLGQPLEGDDRPAGRRGLRRRRRSPAAPAPGSSPAGPSGVGL